jgi:CDP-diacylglycerol--serine O-phosphatidyltransferase
VLLKLKDIPTVLAICVASAAIPFSLHGAISTAGFAIIFATLLDLLDGIIARLTKTQNQFGAEFDCIVDLVIYSVGSFVLIFFALAQHASTWVAFAAALPPLVSGCIRLARFNVKRVEYPGFWIGLPRPGVAAVMVSYVNSSLFTALHPVGVTSALSMIVALLTVSLIPYPGHHHRQLTLANKTLIFVGMAALLVSSATGHFWDAAFAISISYMFSPLMISRAERARLRDFISQWRSEERLGIE